MRGITVEKWDSGVKVTVLGLEIEARRLFGRSPEDRSPYMSQLIIGRLRFHLFHRGDEDPDPHDHPWSFTTFPLRSYVEEVTDTETRRRSVVYVSAFHFHHRPASYTHRVLYPAAGPRDTWIRGRGPDRDRGP